MAVLVKFDFGFFGLKISTRKLSFRNSFKTFVYYNMFVDFPSFVWSLVLWFGSGALFWFGSETFRISGALVSGSIVLCIWK